MIDLYRTHQLFKQLFVAGQNNPYIKETIRLYQEAIFSKSSGTEHIELEPEGDSPNNIVGNVLRELWADTLEVPPVSAVPVPSTPAVPAPSASMVPTLSSPAVPASAFAVPGPSVPAASALPSQHCIPHGTIDVDETSSSDSSSSESSNSDSSNSKSSSSEDEEDEEDDEDEEDEDDEDEDRGRNQTIVDFDEDAGGTDYKDVYINTGIFFMLLTSIIVS